MRNAFILVGLVGASALVGCGSDGNGGAGPGDAGGTGATTGNGGANTGNGGASMGTGGGIGKATGGNGGAGAGPNQYPSSMPVSSCFGDCPLGECDNDGFWSDTPCTSVYHGPVDQSSSYCGASDGSYCLQLSHSFGDQYAVQCASGKTTIHQCTTGCGSVGTGPHVCD